MVTFYASICPIFHAGSHISLFLIELHMYIEHTFNCSAVATMLKGKSPELGHLSYSSMSNLLFANDVTTLQEKHQIDRLIGQEQIEAVLGIVIPSLRAGQTAKYRGLLIAMEKSEDTLLKEKAAELGECIGNCVCQCSISP